MNNSIKNTFKYIPFVILSSIIQSISLSSFAVPGNMYSSGVTGLSRLTSDLLNDYLNINIKYTIFLIIINIILAIIVYKYIGKAFTFLSLLQTGLLSLLASFMPKLVDVDDLLLLSIFGGIVNGFGVGLALTHNASTGGTDFLSIYLSNRYKKSMWNLIFGFNCVLIVITGIIYGPERALYSIIYQFCSTQVVNKMHKRYTSETINIITEKPDEVSKEIFETVRHGITKIDAEGEFKHTKTSMLYTVVNGYQTSDVVKAILRADPKAFINIQDTKLVYGNYYQKPLD